MTVTFILNVEDTRRKAKNFSVNLTRGVNVLNEVEAENERRRDDIVEDIPQKEARISLSPPIFSLVVRDFELGFGGDIVSPDVDLVTQIGTGQGDPDDFDYITIDISDNENPRVDLNSTNTLNIRLGTETFASAVFTVGELIFDALIEVDTHQMFLSLPEIAWEVGANEGELNLHKITLTTDVAVEYSNNPYFETLPVTLTTSTLGVEFGGNIESLGLGLGPVDSGFDSEINLRLPNNMVTSPDFDA